MTDSPKIKTQGVHKSTKRFRFTVCFLEFNDREMFSCLIVDTKSKHIFVKSINVEVFALKKKKIQK